MKRFGSQSTRARDKNEVVLVVMMVNPKISVGLGTNLSPNKANIHKETL